MDRGGNKSITSALVQNLEAFGSIWDIKHPYYHNKERREEDFTALAQIVGVPIEVLKRKYNSLRTKFRKVFNGAEQETRDGDGQSQAYIPKSWSYYEDLKFLLPTLKRSGTIDRAAVADSRISEGENDTPTHSTNGDTDHKASINTAPPIIAKAPAATVKRKISTPKIGATSEKRRPHTDTFESQLRANNYELEYRQKPDIYSHFANMIAEDLRAMPDLISARVLMNKIQTVVTEFWIAQGSRARCDGQDEITPEPDHIDN